MKKFISILILTALALTLCACGQPAPEAVPEPVADRMYVSFVAASYDSGFWSEIRRGAEDAAKDSDVYLYFDGPVSDDPKEALQNQTDIFNNEITKLPDAVCFAPISAASVSDALSECFEKGIPLIGVLSEIPEAPSGAVTASVTSSSDSVSDESAYRIGYEAVILAVHAANGAGVESECID